MNSSLLKITNLKTYFFTNDGVSRAVDGINLQIRKGETLGIVGESGCGKSVTALSIMRLIPQPPGKIVEGEILFNSQNLLAIREEEMRELRGKKISMIFQDPMSSLNPVFRVIDQISEAIYCHEKISKKEADEKAIHILDRVGFPDPVNRARQYPHQLSGGLRQRVMIAMALACGPDLLIADEPTTALDVTVQAQILDLLLEIQEKQNISMIFVSHDLGVIASICQQVSVFYAGQVVEKLSVQTLFENPRHPYTQGLLSSIPRETETLKSKKLFTIPGIVPSPTSWPSGCRFHTRCKFALDKCRHEEPPEFRVEDGQVVKCWLCERD